MEAPHLRRWPHGPLNRVERPGSKYRYILESVTQNKEVEWHGSFRSKRAALETRLRLRQDWVYQVFDAHTQKVVWQQGDTK